MIGALSRVNAGKMGDRNVAKLGHGGTFWDIAPAQDPTEVEV